MEISKQSQSAGDNAQQIQAGIVMINQGITEERAREIFSEMSVQAIKENTIEAESKAMERINLLKSICIPRIEKEDAIFECFSDPAFQVLLKKVQLTAACTERDDDYTILSELLVHRIKNRANVKKKASISKAVEIIDQIDDDSLMALTVFLLMERYIPTNGNIEYGLEAIDKFYGKFDLNNLPTDVAWQDNLAILGAITTNQIVTLKKFEDYFSEQLCGYVCAGIKKDSEDYIKAIELLSECGMSEQCFDNNILLDDYVRLPVTNRDMIKQLKIVTCINGIKSFDAHLNKSQIDCCIKVFDMYSKDGAACSQVKERFAQILNGYSNIHKAIEWWNSIPHSILLTSVGRVIAHANAKRIDPTLPDLD